MAASPRPVVPTPLSTRERALLALLSGGIILLYLARLLLSDDPHSAATLLRWGAYQGEAMSSGQWWRIITYSFVYADGTQLLIDALAIVVLGVVIARVQSFALSFSAYRLGLFAALLGFIFIVPPLHPVASTSGPAYSMLGTLLMLFVLSPARLAALRPVPGQDIRAAGQWLLLLGLTGALLLGQLVANRELILPGLISAAAGALSATIAQVVIWVKARQASREPGTP